MSDSPIAPEPAAPSTLGADEIDNSLRARIDEIDDLLCALMDRVAALEARVDLLELEVV